MHDDFDLAVSGFARWVESMLAERKEVGRGKRARSEPKHTIDLILGIPPEQLKPKELDLGGPSRFGGSTSFDGDGLMIV